jgi:hypothetical protein
MICITAVNLALNRPTWQSSTYSENNALTQGKLKYFLLIIVGRWQQGFKSLPW